MPTDQIQDEGELGRAPGFQRERRLTGELLFSQGWHVFDEEITVRQRKVSTHARVCTEDIPISGVLKFDSRVKNFPVLFISPLRRR